MTRRHLTWARLVSQVGPAAELAQDALDNPELPFQFADDEDKALRAELLSHIGR